MKDLLELELVTAEKLAANQAAEEAATRAAEVVLEEQPEDTEEQEGNAEHEDEA